MATGNFLIFFLSLFFLFFSGQCIHDAGTLPNEVGIYGGHEISITEVPFMASLRIDEKYHFCGASIIHKQFVLTAAHCIIENRKYKVSVGTNNIKRRGKLYDVEKIIVHQNYNSTTKDYDICIIKLINPLEFGTTVNKIKLRGAGLKRGTIVEAVGWGRTPNSSLSNRLLQVSIPIVSKTICQMSYINFKQIITRRMLCAGDIGKDSCEADSGGPLIYNNTIVGIVSFGLNYCGVKPGVYTKIKPLRKWIRRTIKANS